MKILTLRCYQDNYAHVIICPETNRAAVVDPSDMAPIIAAMEAHHCIPAWILLTHHHLDHVAGLPGLLEHGDFKVAVHPVDGKQIEGWSPEMALNSTITMGSITFQVLHTPGHTLGHCCYLAGDALFTGDTVFVGGCGRLFEGTAAQMLGSLDALAELPDEIRIFSGHEYTLSNLDFAASLEPDNGAIEKKARQAEAQLGDGDYPVASTIAQEKTFNPFFRARIPALIEGVRKRLPGLRGDALSVFTAVRKLKDRF